MFQESTVTSRFYNIFGQKQIQRKIEVQRKIETLYFVNYDFGHVKYQIREDHKPYDVNTIQFSIENFLGQQKCDTVWHVLQSKKKKR